ncbi:MAG TPA: sigma-70 family RNA polymerase sigma factor [Thermoanaerobaculia bacterium]
MPRPATPSADALEALYNEHRVLLLYIATHKFHVPDDEAETLLHDVFLSYMLKDTLVENVRSWLVASTCNACRSWLRRRRRTIELPPHVEEELLSPGGEESMVRTYLIRQTLGKLTAKQCDILQRHYLDGETANEIASSLGRTVRGVEKSIFAALQRVRRLLE